MSGLQLRNVSGNPLSIYGQKFAEWSAKFNWIRPSSEVTHYIGRKYSADLIKRTMTHGTIEEMEYEGHQILVIGYHFELQYYIDKSGARITDSAEIANSTLESEVHKISNYYAMGYRHSDSHQDLEWRDRGSLFSMIYTSTSSKSTFKKAMKRIDLENKILAVKDDLTRISGDRWSGGMRSSNSNDYAPYNAVIGDEVFIQAHGRLRKGIVVDTIGSRFVVGYVTPSNTRDMKYKTVPLNLMYI